MNTLKWILVCTIIVSGVQSFGQNINTPNKKGPLGTEVNTLSGNLFLLRNDIYIPSRELDISLTFYYNSFNFDQNIGFGNGWSNTYSAYYFNDTANGKIIVWGDGREDEYSFSGTDYIPQSGVFSKLILYQPNKYKIIEQNGRQYFFDNPVHKKLTRIEEPNGNFIQLNYTDSLLTGISNTAGQTITLAYNAAGNLQSITENVTTPAKTFTYSYDNAKNLTRVTDPLNGKINYSYLVNGPMKSLGDKNNNTVDIIYYGDYLAREIIGCNKRISFSYDSTLQETTVTEYLQSGINQTTHYKYQNIDKNVWLTSMTSNCCGNDVSFEYDRNGNKIKQTDANGNESTYTYDDRGNVLTIKDALNQTTTYTYSSDFNKITSITDPKGLKSILSYDVKGNLIQLIEPGNLVFTATYNSNGDITSSTNPKGNIFNYNYDALGNPLSVTGPNAYSATLSYDARGNLLSFKDARNNTSNLEYDILNRLKKITDPINNTIQFTYDAVGNATQVKNQNGENSLLQYDASNRLVQFADAMGNKTNMQYDAMNNLTAIQNAVGGGATFSYDAKNRLTDIKDALGNTTNFQYDNKGNLISGTLPSGENFVYSYDEIDRLTKISDATGTLMELSFDANDNIIQLKNGLGSTIFAEYDSINRVKKIIDPSNNSMLLQYDKNSNIISITDRNGYTSSYTYDGMDRVKTFTDNNGSVTTADYDAQGNIIALTDANNNTTQYTYDSQNRIVRTIYPDGKYLEFTYNNKGNITNKRLADGSNILFAYDTLNRIVSKTIPGGQVFTYTYDAIGRIKTATNNAGVVAFEYDVLNRIISENFGGRTIQYAYNTAGRTQTTVYPDSTLIAKVYDTRNRLININKNGNRLVTYQYNNANQLISKTYANGIITNYQYNTANQLISYSTGNAIQNAILTYDNEMHKTSITRQNNLSQSEQFTYDNGHRLTQYKRGENGNPTIQNSYTYDALGNRTQANLNGVNTQYTPNNLNQLINSNNGTLNINFTYDDRGNLTYDGYFYKTYDALGRLMKDSAAPSNIITYAYDALGRRIQKNVNGNISNYTYSGLAAIEERDGVGNIKNKTIFNDFTTPVVNENAGTEFYYHQNELNSVEAITNNNGLLTEQYLYDVYGKQTMLDSAGNVILSSITGNRFGFTGQVYDSATGQIQFLFRTYNPSTGTFNERDLIGYADGMGMYQYVGNNPANGIDVFGLAADPCDPTKASTDWGLYNSTINFISTVDGKFEGLGRVQKMIDAKLSEGKKIVEHFVELRDILRQERNWKAANRVSAEAIRRFKDLGLLNELSKYAQMAKNGVQLAGRVTGVIDVGIKLYNYLNIISDLNSSWTDVARGIADIEIAVAAVAEKPIAAAYGIADFLVERASGKNITSWAAAGVDNSLEGLNTAYDFYSGRVRKPKPSPDNHWKPQKPIDCPQNGEIGGKRRRKYWYYLSGGDSVEVIQSLDPNAIIGPEGVTPKKWVSVHDVLPYTILFENDKSATAPAKFVRINYPIDSKQDPATFTLGSFGFNNLTYTIPPNTPAYTQRLDARDSLGLYIDVTAGLDVINNQAFWEFNSIDPITLLPTNNPLSGFLLLQDSTKTNYGHGFVNFNIQPRRTDITLDTIHARADIIFDSNDTIPTNYHTNTVDAFAPTSSMIALPATSTNPVALSWTGVDDTNGSGVQSYTLYVSTNGVSFYALRSGITRTDTTITLAPDSTYCFFVLATDSVGNTETLRAGEIKCTMVGNNIVLPISWLYFNGTNRNTDNYLEWATGFEQNVKEFKLERSIPGGNFTTIATIPATGNSSTAQSYNYLDKRVHQLNSPTLLYRIKEIERDGKYTYSNIVRLLNSTKGKINSIVYPNPTSGTITVVVGDKALIGTQARIYDVNSRLLKEVKITAQNQSIDLSGYINGLYMIKLVNNETLRIMKL